VYIYTPTYREDVSEVVGVDVAAAEVVEHLRELHEGEVVVWGPAAVEVEAHGLQGGGAAVAGHVAVQHQHKGRVAHEARHPKQGVESAGLEVVRGRPPLLTGHVHQQRHPTFVVVVVLVAGTHDLQQAAWWSICSMLPASS